MALARTHCMTFKDAGHDRTIQDDRAELGADPGQGSPLAEGEGSPLGQDDTATNPRDASFGMLGGAPVPTALDVDASQRAGDGLGLPDNRPTGD